MKNLITRTTPITLSIASLLFGAAQAFAQGADVAINIVPPNGITKEAGQAGTVLSNIIKLIIFGAALIVIFMLIWGAFEWITSGGDKEHIAKARSKIVNALIGLVILAIAFLIAAVAQSITGLPILSPVLPKIQP